MEFRNKIQAMLRIEFFLISQRRQSKYHQRYTKKFGRKSNRVKNARLYVNRRSFTVVLLTKRYVYYRHRLNLRSLGWHFIKEFTVNTDLEEVFKTKTVLKAQNQ